MSGDTLALLQTLLNGALLGCLFGLIALGLTMKWGHLGVPDFFHLSLTLFSGYLTYTLVTGLLMNPFLTLLITVPAMFVIGVLTQWLFFTIKASAFTSLLLTFALFIVAESVMSVIWSPDMLSMRSWLDSSFTTAIRIPVGDKSLSVLPVDVMALVLALVLVLATWWMLKHTRWGRALQAMRQDAQIAEVLGVRILPITLIVSGLAAATAAVAGMVVVVRMPLTPGLAMNWIGVVIVATLLGGLGRPLGALIAAIVLMMVQNAWSLWFPPQWSPAVAFGLLFIYLALTPIIRIVRERVELRRNREQAV
ncbi:branched-chain amino acid ABC transporter permease [Leucobacter albus]|uniref:Branched-chain amino acid ABC transporter permease n=1 Tax=Leucobacter albus TaxID=272210 RepID=A0ABW3TLU8_9MICO